MSVQLQNFFKSCDPEGTSSVDKEAFRDLCNRLNISQEDADLIFDDLDLDRDGRISFADFSRGFSNFLSNSVACEPLDDHNNDGVGNSEDPEETTKQQVWTTLTTEAERVGKKSSDEGKLKWLLNELQASEQRHLVPYLESAVEELLGNLHQLQEEKTRLEESWRREKLEHERHMKRMEEELDQQVKEAEMRLRLQAQEEVEGERKSLQTKMDTELDKVQAHLVVMEKVYSWLRNQPTEQRDVRLDEVRSKLDEAVHENRQLRMSLLDTQTSIALMRGELLQLRTMYEEKCRELSSERERILEVLQEQDHLSRQLNLLHDANKRLLDSHDALRSSVENTGKLHDEWAQQKAEDIHLQFQLATEAPARGKSGSIIGDYLDLRYSPDLLDRFTEDEEAEEDDSNLRRAKSMDISFPIKRRSKSADRQSARQSLNQSDSGVSTVRDSCEPDENWDMSPHSPENHHESDEGDDEEDNGRDTQKSSRRDSTTPSRMSRTSSVQSPSLDKVSKLESKNSSGVSFRMKSCASQDSLLDPETFPRRKISDIKKQLGIEDKPANWTRSWSPNPRKCSTPKEKLSPDGTPEKGIMPPTPLPRTKMITSTIDNKDKEETDRTEASNSELNNNSVEESDYEYEPTGPAEQTFKVIFVGDAGVGKSSFALRISKGVFVRHMSSTLGIDFLMRTIRVDGRNVAVQLWDTAGQERFRSITKSYFRKADGVMLLYDCTCEHSFLNVRQWVEDIDVSCFYSMMAEKTPSGRKASSQRIPLMIVANKIDLRDMAVRTGVTCISTEEGEKLAKDCDTTFMEASAKDGSNVLHALANLVRSMRTQQELQLSASTMQLCDKKAKKSGSCCGK